MRFFVSIFFFILFHTTIAQNPNIKIVESKDIPIDSLSSNEEINSIENELILPDSSQDGNLKLISNENIPSENIPIIEVPVFDLQDDPEIAALDLKWLDLVKFYEQFDSSSLFIESIPTENIVVEELSTALLKKRLAALDAKSPFNISYNPELETIIKSFIKNRAKSISGLMSKSKYYFPLFEEKLDLYDVPLEVKYLAIVESALQPKARSRVGATGLWQFMYQTGKQYGLDVTSYVDERQDPILSSEAAAQHLSDLYDLFEDWDLALAAYNSGAGNVNKAIRRAGGKKNYWNLRPYLPRETANYVPLFYATLYVFEYGHLHNILPDKEFKLNHYEIDTLHVKRNISFEQLKTTTGIDISLLEFLNPIYKLNVVPFESDKTYPIVLPKPYVGLFLQNEEKIYAYVDSEEAKREKPLPENITINPVASESKTIYHRVKRGEYLGWIAEKYKVSVKNVMKWNHLKSTKVYVGQKLKIYKSGTSQYSTNSINTSVKNSNSKESYTTYIVKKGDTLMKIANKYRNVSIQDIKKWNKLKGDNIKTGTRLKIYKG